LDLHDILKSLLEFRDARDWAKFHNPKDLALSVSIEAGELLELFQWKSADEVESLAADPAFRNLAAGEISDVLIYLLLLADRLGIDPIRAARNKIDENESRFPRSQ
jgi:NTP pyrophosphatase (non-canonical NTP hydrolase)